MKLAVSNIAWPAELDNVAFQILVRNKISGVEVAPTRVWPQWQGITPGSVREFQHLVESQGLRISSLQSILFQKPDLILFGSAQVRAALADHLRRCADLAAGLGARCLVFGAPKNRDRGALSEGDAFAIALEFFQGIAPYYAARQVFLGFEANPEEYGCNFAAGSATAARLVRAVCSEGFRLHLDSACMLLAREDAVSAIAENAGILGHFHASEPHLGTFSVPLASHATIAGELERVNYNGWVAVEMRATNSALVQLEEGVRFLRRTYGGGN